MAKAVSLKVKLVSSADTGHFYVTKKNSRTMTDKLVKKKYDPVAKKHVEYREFRDEISQIRAPRGALCFFSQAIAAAGAAGLFRMPGGSPCPKHSH